MIARLLTFALSVGAVGAAVTDMWGAFYACLLAGLVSTRWWDRDTR